MGNSERKKPPQKPFNSFLKFTGLGFQLALTIGVSTWLGYLLDMQMGTLPLFLLLFIVGSLVGNIYLILQAGKEND